MSKPPGIKEIAFALSLSIGTVDRALHGRAGINAATKARILEAAAAMEYRPNLAARQLKLNRHLQVGIYLPQHIRSFFEPLREGIRAAAAAVHGIQVKLTFHDYPRLGSSDLAVMKGDAAAHYDAVILSPGNPKKIAAALKRLAQQNTAVVCVATDAPDSPRIASVAIDARMSGGLAAELLGCTLPGPGSVAVLTGDLQTEDHLLKQRGFEATCAALHPSLKLLPAVQTHDQPREAYQATLRLMRKRPRPGGLYVSTANSLPVLEALREAGLLGKIQIVTTDLYGELVPFLRSGDVLATLDQRPFMQGKAAFEAVAAFLLRAETPPAPTRLAPHIIMRSNLPLSRDEPTMHDDFES
ncbi:LacI family DNA-binding transcriptional regulator [Acidipila sp. EB88]|nr:LacI family DNA-binding transcriptional regulator [Acidipila sp. EB88]